MRLDKYTPEHRAEMLARIAEELAGGARDYFDDEMVTDFLKAIIDRLDHWDGYDAISSEGWRHSFGVDA